MKQHQTTIESPMRNKTRHKLEDVKQLASLSVDDMTFELTCYETIVSIQKLEDEWKKLHEICKENFTFFQGFDWCLQYYKQFADDLTDKDCPIPQVFVLRHKDEPIMIWPLMRIHSRIGIKILTTATDPLGQYCNLLCSPSKFNTQIGIKTLKEIMANSKSDTLSLYNVPKDCMVDSIIANKGIKENSQLESSILDFEPYEDWDSYTKTLSKAQRKNRKRSKTKLESVGVLDYKIHKAGSDEFKNNVKLALEMKTKWLTETGRKPGLLAEQRTLQMFTDLEAGFTESTLNSEAENSAFIHVLYLDEKPIAIEIGMIKSSHYYSYLGAIDWAYKDYAPGKVQMEMAQQWAMEKGIQFFDLLHDPSEYKNSWSNKKHPVMNKNIPMSVKGYAYNILWKTYMRPKIKSLYHFAGADKREKFNKYIGLIFKK